MHSSIPDLFSQELIPTLSAELKDLFYAAYLVAFREKFPTFIGENKQENKVEITRSTQREFGHYQCNSAMKLSKLFKQPPRAIAEAWKSAVLSIQEHCGKIIVDKIDIAGPGFLNVWLDKEYISSKALLCLHQEKLGIVVKRQNKIVIDFSSPNIAKEMHVGHLRSTIIGDCLARVFEFLGHDVIRLNHVGDWGTAFGMLIAYIEQISSSESILLEQMSLSDLMHHYKASKKLFDEDSGFKKKAQLQVVALQSGNPESLKAWQTICQISRTAYQSIYEALDVQLIERGESFYNPLLEPLIKDLESKGILSISEGAKCLFLEGFTGREGEALPFMVQKADGGYLYATTDLAALVHRIQKEKADRIIYVTDSGQSAHFMMLFAAGIKAGYLDPQKVRVDHVPFGLVLGPDGKKFRSRSGETERLIDLLNAAVGKARQVVEERHSDWLPDEKEHLARVLGIGAVKYADLSSNRISDYVFSYDKMLRLEGNTAAFLLYAYVRINGIKRKIGVLVDECIHNSTRSLQLEHPSEILLALKVAQFSEVLENIVNDLLPNRLTDYLHDLAEEFNIFFRDCRVEGSPQEESRLLLVECVARTLEVGLHLLGISVVERM